MVSIGRPMHPFLDQAIQLALRLFVQARDSSGLPHRETVSQVGSHQFPTKSGVALPATKEQGKNDRVQRLSKNEQPNTSRRSPSLIGPLDINNLDKKHRSIVLERG